MSSWRGKAIEILPELRTAIEESPTPYRLWFVLWDAFKHAYDQSPRDESLIRRIYQYSDWCIDQPQGDTASDDLTTCVAVTFYEHIPQHQAARDDMLRWFTLEDITSMERIFNRMIGPSEYAELKRYVTKHQNMYVDRFPET
jgi:hypothetical protein